MCRLPLKCQEDSLSDLIQGSRHFPNQRAVLQCEGRKYRRRRRRGERKRKGKTKQGGQMKKWKRKQGRKEKRKGGGERRDPCAHLGETAFYSQEDHPESQPLVTASKLFFAFLSSQPTFCAIWISWSKNIPQTSQSAGMGWWTRVLIHLQMFLHSSFPSSPTSC